MTNNCLNCGADLSHKRSDAIYCDDTCRKAHRKKTKLAGEYPCQIGICNCGSEFKQYRVDLKTCGKRECVLEEKRISMLPEHLKKQTKKVDI
jgi:hypothetical protein